MLKKAKDVSTLTLKITDKMLSSTVVEQADKHFTLPGHKYQRKIYSY